MIELRVLIILLFFMAGLILYTFYDIYKNGNKQDLKNNESLDYHDFVNVSIPTFLWFLIIVGLVFFTSFMSGISEQFDLQKHALKLNEWGDFLAGFFAPIIFIWLVFGVYIQKKEFHNAVTEYKKSINILNKQSVLTDIQHKNTWFDRNVDMLEKYIDKIVNSKNKPLISLWKSMVVNTIHDYNDIAIDIKNIVALNQYITNNLCISDDRDDIYNKAIEKLLEEYNILFGEAILASQKIYIKIYLQIFLANEKVNEDDIDEEEKEDRKQFFKGYYDLKEWITNENKILIHKYIDDNTRLDSSFIDTMHQKVFDQIEFNQFLKGEG